MINVYPKSFLEIGCGGGDFLKILENLGWRGCGIDISSKIIEVAKKKVNPDNISIFLSKNIKEKKLRQDLVFALEVLEHIENDKETLIGWREYLNGKSKLVISVPSHERKWTRHDLLAGHVRRYERDNLIELFKSAGFIIEKIICYGFPILNIMNVIRGVIARKDPRWHLSRQKRVELSGINRWKEIGFVRERLLKLIVVLFYPVQKLLWRFDIGDGYIILASLKKNQ